MVQFFFQTTGSGVMKIYDQPSKSVAILLCTMQGQIYLREQLDSIVSQTHHNWTIWVSDDGSNDNTHTILNEYLVKLGESKLIINSGPSAGFVANFLSLACKDSITADYYAFADQDDVWEVDKLEHALHWLQTLPSQLPALYCGRTRSVDASNKDLGFSPLFAKQPCFTNALVQSIAGGNTMLFNNAARRLLLKAGPEVNVVSHDWWVYMIVSGCGGHVFYDPTPKVRYRQHGNNLVGVKKGFAAGIVRIRMLVNRRFEHWNDLNLAALQSMRKYLSPENKVALDEFTRARKNTFYKRLIGLKHSGIHRQTFLGNIGLIAAGILKKI